MKHTLIVFFIVLIISFLNLIGCSSSQESTDKQESTTPPVTQKAPDQSLPKGDVVTPPKADTLSVDKQKTQKPPYESESTSQHTALPVGRFSVQLGAYKMQDNAEHIAALAKERFGKNVYTLVDKMDNLYKVLVGDFMTKDEARGFRDEMVQKFPADYKDAWVSDLSQK